MLLKKAKKLEITCNVFKQGEYVTPWGTQAHSDKKKKMVYRFGLTDLEIIGIS